MFSPRKESPHPKRTRSDVNRPEGAGLPPRIVIPVLAVFAVLFLGIMGYFIKVGLSTSGSAFGAGTLQGDAKIQATAAPIVAATDPPGTVDIPQSGTGAGAAVASGAQPPNAQPVEQQAPVGAPPGNTTGGGPPPAVRQAIDDLKGRIAKNPRDLAALVTLANFYFDAQKFDQAGTYYQRALALDPGNPDVRTDYAVVEHQTGHDLEALVSIDAILKSNPTFTPALFNRGVILSAIGRRTEAAGAYKHFIAVAPRDPHVGDAKTALKELGATP